MVVARGIREAQPAKLLENTYRHVNIGLLNEMSAFCHELDVDLWDAIARAATKSFGHQPFYPGPGVGGHCISYLLAAVARAQLGSLDDKIAARRSTPAMLSLSRGVSAISQGSA